MTTEKTSKNRVTYDAAKMFIELGKHYAEQIKNESNVRFETYLTRTISEYERLIIEDETFKIQEEVEQKKILLEYLKKEANVFKNL